MKKALLFSFIPVVILMTFLPANAQTSSYSSTAKTWTGASSTDWYSAGNWTGGIPTASDDVIIPVGLPRYPTLSLGSTTVCNNLYLNPAGTFASNAGGLDVAGFLTVTGNLTIGFPSKLTVKSNGSLTITGTMKITSPNGPSYSTLVIENNGSLITGCNTVYQPYNSTPYRGTGYPVVERTIVQDMKWHALSSPVLNQPIANKDFAPTPGTFAAIPNTVWDFYEWLSTCPDPPYDENWRNLRNPDGTQNFIDFSYPSYFESGRGYMVAYGNWHGTTQGFTNNQTKAFYGPLNSCCEGFDFHNANTICPIFWELIGNPFSSAFDWSLVTEKENLANDYYYIYNENKVGGAGYEYWSDAAHHSAGTDGFIPSMQAFFVEVLTDGGRFVGLPLTARVHHNTTDTWLKESPADKLTLTISNGSYSDQSDIIFEPDGNIGRDRKDASKMFSLDPAVPQIYTIINNEMKACSNSLPYLENGMTVPVGFVAPYDDNYTISAGNISSFSSLTGLSIEDLKLNVTQDLLKNPVYSFTATGIEDAGRFLLHFGGPISINEKTNHSLSIYSNEKTVYITRADGFKNAMVTISNLLGQKVISQVLYDQKINLVQVDGPKGYYIVKVQDESSVSTAKIYIH